MSDFNFKIDPSNYAGIDHEAYRSDMLQLALSQPTVYTQLRKDVLQTVKKEAVNTQYAIYYNLLTKGQNPDGGSVLSRTSSRGLGSGPSPVFNPRVPNQIVNELIWNMRNEFFYSSRYRRSIRILSFCK